MNDNRSFQEIMAQHPAPWSPRTMRQLMSGQAVIQLFDKSGVEVPLFTMLRVVQLVTDKIANGATP